jgi:hypothetical protein
MEIHRPKPWHGLREFFKEYAIIVLGVLTAIALEQTVEIIHRQQDRTELRESLQRETDQILLDAARVEKSEHADIDWQKQVGDILAIAYRSHKPLGNFPTAPNTDFDVPDDPIYRAAQSSGKLTLLSKDEREAYCEMHNLIEVVGGAYVKREDALTAGIETQHEIRFGRLDEPTSIHDDLRLSPGYNALAGSTLSPQDLRRLFDDTVRIQLKRIQFLRWSRSARGAATALKRGERSIQKIEAAERQFDNLP